MTKRFLRTEDFSIYSVLLGPDGRFAGIEKRPEPRNTSRRPIPTNLDAALEDQHAQSGAEAASAAPEEAVLEDDITDTEVEKIVGGFPASSQNLQDVPEDVTLDPNGPTSFEAEVTDAEAEKIVQEIAAASPILQDSTLQESAETVSTESFPIEEAEAPVDEAFLAAKLDFADPLTFKVRLLMSAEPTTEHANNSADPQKLPTPIFAPPSGSSPQFDLQIHCHRLFHRASAYQAHQPHPGRPEAEAEELV